MAFDEKDFVVYREDNKIKSGGYTINSILLNKNSPALTTFNKQEGGAPKKVSDIFSNLAVPAGLFYGTEKKAPPSITPIIVNNDAVLPDSIHDQLLELLEPGEKHLYNIKTKRRNLRNKKNKKLKKTRKTF